MIYVITEPRYKSEVTIDDIKSGKSFETEPCIKIGYSIDFKNRLSQYMTDTPRIDVLYTYEEGTEEDEKRLHKYFEKYKTSDLNGNEWFRFDKEFIDFFEASPGIEDIRSKISHIKLSKKEEQVYQLLASRIVLSMVYLQLDLKIDISSVSYGDIDYLDESFQEVIKSDILFNYYLEKIKPKTNEEFLEFLKSELSEDDYNHLFESYNKQLNIDITNELKSFNKLVLFTDKMEFICNHVFLEQEKFEKLLNSIPKSFKNYFTVLGPAKCKAHKYQKGEMEKEYQRLFNNQRVNNLDDRVYDAFHAGERIKKADIKKALGKIYQDTNFQQTAKAVDINQWFNVKPVKINDPSAGKRVDGFELISRITPPTP